MEVRVMSGVAGPTYLYTGTDTVGGACPFGSTVLDDANGRKLKGALLECDAKTGNGVRYAYGAAPLVDTMHYLAPGSTLLVQGSANCKALRIINDVNAAAAKLWVTPEY